MLSLHGDLLSTAKDYALQLASGSIVVVGALVAWLGRVSEKRIIARQQASHATAIEVVRADLTRSVQSE
jgi:hypothetical protein